MILTSERYVIKSIKKETRAELFENIEESDIIEISHSVSGEIRAPQYIVTNLMKEESRNITGTNMMNILEDNFEIIPESSIIGALEETIDDMREANALKLTLVNNEVVELDNVLGANIHGKVLTILTDMGITNVDIVYIKECVIVDED